jgi:2'-hydroxyisoflavone reductase
VKVLIIGGTQFLGLHTVRAVLSRGHEVTTFNRGTRPGLFAKGEVEELRGDRDGGLGILDGRTWDTVIDVPGYLPRVVRQSAQLFANRVDRYVFISSISVYAGFPTAGLDESGTLESMADETNEDVAANYGALKVLCEREVEAAFPSNAVIIRPGLIVGPNDPTGRFTYWPVRMGRGGEVLAPDSPDVPVQVIDVRDLAAWTVRMAESGPAGVYNATGPRSPLALGEFLRVAAEACGVSSSVTFASEEFLLSCGVAPWSDLPLWLRRASANMSRVSVDKAVGAGLSFRPLANTISDTLSWARESPESVIAGMSAERESDLLQRWRETLVKS